jgi:hypothetical protein
LPAFDFAGLEDEFDASVLPAFDRLDLDGFALPPDLAMVVFLPFGERTDTRHLLRS